jgi:D-alanine transaminase
MALMARVAYVNGRYVPVSALAIAIEDRGYQFADGIYEVVKVLGGRPCDLERHLDRLQRSLAALSIAAPMTRAALRSVLAETLRRNRLATALLYIQVSRGAAPRNHPFPKAAVPSLVVTVRRPVFPSAGERAEGARVVSLPDQRWGRCDIKSISLLANVLARQQAATEGCREAFLVTEEGVVTEGSASNAYIVDRDGRLITHPLGERILGGVTRAVLLELARADGIEVVERPFTLAEAKTAREVALTSTTSLVLPVTEIDGQPIGNGRPGSVTERLMALYDRHLAAETLPAGPPGMAPAGISG